MTELLTIEDIAKLYKVTPLKARDFIVRTPGFPDPAPGSTPRVRRWVASEVDAFIKRKSAPIPQAANKSLIYKAA
jgi:hypothetical protein